MIEIFENINFCDSLHGILTKDQPFARVMIKTFGSDYIAIDTLPSSTSILGKLRETIIRHASTLQPTPSLPSLLRLFSNFYFSTENREPSWLGTALKCAIAFIWPNVFADERTRYDSTVDDLADFIHTCSLYDQLKAIPWIYTFKKDLFLLVTSEGVGSNDASSVETMLSWRNAFIKRGQLFRQCCCFSTRHYRSKWCNLPQLQINILQSNLFYEILDRLQTS